MPREATEESSNGMMLLYVLPSCALKLAGLIRPAGRPSQVASRRVVEVVVALAPFWRGQASVRFGVASCLPVGRHGTARAEGGWLGLPLAGRP